MQLVVLEEGARIFLASLNRRFFPKKYGGNGDEICQSIIDDCWNGKFFRTSTGHFCQFYCRDFGICAEPLIRLGYSKKVSSTLEFALSKFESHGRVRVAMTPYGKPFDFPHYGVDSLAFLLRALKVANCEKLVERHRDFLNDEISFIFNNFVDKETGLILKGAKLSSMRDYSARNSSCYDNCMLGMIKADSSFFGLNNPFESFDYFKIIKKSFWNGKFFEDDLNRKGYVCGDANIFPCWSGLFGSEFLKKSINAIKLDLLDKPFPLKYVKKSGGKMVWYEFIVKDWETNSIWAQLGFVYLSLLKKIDFSDFSSGIKTYKGLIEKNRNVVEVFSQSGNPYSSIFYYADRGLLWAAIYLDMVRN